MSVELDTLVEKVTAIETVGDSAVTLLHDLKVRLDEAIESADPEALLAQKMEEYRKSFAHPFLAARRGYIDDVIFPRDTRHRLIRTLQFLEGKKMERPDRKHGNIPL